MSSPNWWGDWRPTLTPHTGNLLATDLIECTMIVGGLPVNTVITGAQILGAVPTPSVAWGSITGTLSSQTDLNTALSGKASTGAVTGTGITMSTATILGRSTAGTGAIEEITIGSGLTLSAGTLTASGGGLTIGTTAIASGTIGRVLFQGTGNVLQQSANLFWDNTNSRLGIGTSSPNMSLDIRTGNVGIGVTSDAGFKLDVNGTARVSGQITGQAQFTNSTSTSTNAILLNGINTTDTGTRGLINIGILSSTGILYGAIGIQATLQNYSVGSSIITNTVEAIGHMVNATSGTVAVNGFMVRTNGQGLGGSIGFTWRVGNSTHFYHSVYNDGTFYNLKLFNRTGDIYYVRDRDTTNITFGSSVYQASAQVAVDSTTKGFLPPRMTTAQKTAIATPAAGLVVYDTTLNKLCVRTASAWETITSL